MIPKMLLIDYHSFFMVTKTNDNRRCHFTLNDELSCIYIYQLCHCCFNNNLLTYLAIQSTLKYSMRKYSVDPSKGLLTPRFLKKKGGLLHLPLSPEFLSVHVLPLAYKNTEDFQDVGGYILDHSLTPWLQNVDPDLCIKVKITSGAHCYYGYI